MRKNPGVEIERIAGGSAAARAGLSAGQRLLSVNGHPVADIIDYLFYKGDEKLEMEVASAQGNKAVLLDSAPPEDPGIELAHFPVRRCRNKCLFCFVEQLPKGLRRPLYVKDEDYRLSFLYGSYITMTNLSEKDRERIAAQRLSPLYISVHSTQARTRKKLLGTEAAEGVMDDLKFLKKNRIRMHTQIVLCPGINDGEDLKKTIRDLCSLYPWVASIAVVPVGLTGHRRQKMRPVLKEDALDALKTVGSFQRRFLKKHGDAVVYGADELYIKADAEFPPLSAYGELPQMENGVGLVPSFLSEARRIKPKNVNAGLKYLTFTGTSFYPILKKNLIDKLNRHGVSITAVPVENRLFGESVTVAGLLSGRDVLKTLSGHASSHDILLVPDCVIREGGDLFLDDVKISDIENALGIRTAVFKSDARGLMEALAAI